MWTQKGELVNVETHPSQLSRRGLPPFARCSDEACIRPSSPPPSGESTLCRAAFSRLVELCRRRHFLTIEELSRRADVAVEELLTIETSRGQIPQPRTVYKLAELFNLPTGCLITLSGQATSCDGRLVAAAETFLAHSMPERRLTRVERRALDTFRQAITSERSSMSKKNVHVVPSGNGWAVKQEGRSSAVSNHRTQQTAETPGRRIARTNEGELVIHRPNGQIRDKDSYGRDPNPPRDRKH